MKEVFIIQDNLENKISYYHLLAFLIMLPFDMFYSELILISLLAHTLIHLKKAKILSLSKPFFVLSSIYLLTIICSVHSVDRQQAFNDFGKHLAILLFPFIFSVTNLNVEKYKSPLLKAFATICVLTSLYLFIDAFRIIQYNKLPFAYIINPAFTNHNFSSPIELHATYFSMYISLSLMVLLHLFIKSSKKTQRILYTACIIILLLALIQLASRAVIIATLLIINFALPFFLLHKPARRNFIICSLLLSSLAILSVTTIDSFKKRLVTELKKDLQKPETGFQTFESRASRWKIALKLIEQAPIIGYGSGSEGKILKEKYYQNRMYVSYLNELNAHNEYLSIMLNSGAIGLIIYLYLLTTGFINLFRKRDFFFASFLIIIVVVSVSENILDTNKGVFFFGFFFSFFAWPISKYKLIGFPFAKHKQDFIPNKNEITLEQKDNSQTARIENVDDLKS